MVRKDDPYIPGNDVARCTGRVLVHKEDFVQVIHPECELCIRRAPVRADIRTVHIAPWPGNGPCPDRYVMEEADVSK